MTAATSRGIVKGPEDRPFEKFRLTGSPRALGEVYDLVAPELLRVANHLTGNMLDAEDLVQRTFVTAIEGTREFDSDQRVLPWLLGILAHHAKNEKRRGARQTDPSRLQPRSALRPDGAAEAAELDQHLQQALASFPEEQRSVLMLRLRYGKHGGWSLASQGVADLIAINDLLGNWEHWMARRKEVQSRRKRPDAEIFHLFLKPHWCVEGEPEYIELQAGLTCLFGIDELFEDCEIKGPKPLG